MSAGPAITDAANSGHNAPAVTNMGGRGKPASPGGAQGQSPAPTVPRSAAVRTSPLLASLEGAWAAVQRCHPEVPPAVIVVASGSSPRGGLRWGHFAASRWERAAVDTSRSTDGKVDTSMSTGVAEVLVSGEGLARGAVPVLGTLLHEAAHALAAARKVKDTSRQGRYHNKRFKAVAEELGLEIAEAAHIGWSVTSVPPVTVNRYAAELRALDGAITVHRRREGDETQESPSRTASACACGCPRRIRVAASVLASGAILCAVCDEPFTPEGSHAR